MAHYSVKYAVNLNLMEERDKKGEAIIQLDLDWVLNMSHEGSPLSTLILFSGVVNCSNSPGVNKCITAF